MSSRMKVDPVTAVLAALARGGRGGREVAVRLDLVRAAGPRVALRRWRDDVHTRRSGDGELDAGSPPFRAIWTDAAAELGVGVRDLGDGFLELSKGASRARVWNHWVPLDDIVAARLALEKDVVHALLTEAGIPIPDHQAVARDELGAAADFVEASPGPCVVKPVGASGGGGVTSGVETRSQLIRAAVRAGRLDERILVERQVEGDAHRLLLLDGELLGIVCRRPPSVVGDGRSSVAALIAQENRRRREVRGYALFQPLRIDLDCLLALERQGLGLASVPPLGERVRVKGVVSQNAAHENETVDAAEADAELVAEARRAASAVGVRLAGIDVVTKDVRRSLRATGGAVLEVNATPGLHYHYDVRQPEKASRVAVPILRSLLGL